MAANDALTCGIVGLGLIGGSLARALKKRAGARVIAYDTDEETLAAAKKARAADVVTTVIDRTFLSCDVIFLSAPVSDNLFHLRVLLPYLRPDTILTDVSSVKEPVHRMTAELAIGRYFVGGHPMAGSEQSGFAASSVRLFDGATWILTRTPETDPARLSEMERLVTLIGAHPVIMDAALHDRAAACVSHLPHVVSAALVNLLARSDDEEETMKRIAAGGFKDLTRISSSSPAMWRQISVLNQKQLSKLLDDYIRILQDAKKMIDRSDAEGLTRFFETARALRDTIDDQ